MIKRCFDNFLVRLFQRKLWVKSKVEKRGKSYQQPRLLFARVRYIYGGFCYNATFFLNYLTFYLIRFGSLLCNRCFDFKMLLYLARRAKTHKFVFYKKNDFFFKQKPANAMLRSLVGSEMCIRDRTKKVEKSGNSYQQPRLLFARVRQFSFR